MRLRDLIPDSLDVDVIPTHYDAARFEIAEKQHAKLYDTICTTGTIPPPTTRGLSISPDLIDFFRAFSSPDVTMGVLHGGRGSGKSVLACQIIALLSEYCAGQNGYGNAIPLRILCTRQIQQRLSASVYSTIQEIVENDPVMKPHFRFMVDRIVNTKTNSEMLFMGIRSNINEIKSLANLTILFLEEASDVTEEQLAILLPTIRAKNAKVIACYNPDLISDWFDIHYRQNAHERQFCIVQAHQWYLNKYLGKSFARQIYDHFNINPLHADHIWNGVPLSGSSASIVNYTALQSCIDSHIALGLNAEDAATGGAQVGYDVGGNGDECASVTRLGARIVHVDEWQGGATQMKQSARRAFDAAARYAANLLFDAVGIGNGGTTDFLAEFKRKAIAGSRGAAVQFLGWMAGSQCWNGDEVHPTENGEKLLRKQVWRDAKAEEYYTFADRVMKTHRAIKYGDPIDPADVVSFDSKRIDKRLMHKLFVELSIPLKWEATDGRLMVEPKESLKRRGHKSPNLAEACIMAQAKSNLPRSSVGFFD